MRTASLFVAAMLLLSTSGLALAEEASASEARAAAFLSTLKQDASEIRELIRKDARFSAGDVGGPFHDVLKSWTPFREVFAACETVRLEKFNLKAELGTHSDLPEWLSKADPDAVRGFLECDEHKTAKVTIIFREGLVSMFQFAWDRTDG